MVIGRVIDDQKKQIDMIIMMQVMIVVLILIHHRLFTNGCNNNYNMKTEEDSDVEMSKNTGGTI